MKGGNSMKKVGNHWHRDYQYKAKQSVYLL